MQFTNLRLLIQIFIKKHKNLSATSFVFFNLFYYMQWFFVHTCVQTNVHMNINVYVYNAFHNALAHYIQGIEILGWCSTGPVLPPGETLLYCYTMWPLPGNPSINNFVIID